MLWALAGYRAYTERQRVLTAKEVEVSKLVVAVEEQTLRLFRLTEATLVATSRWIEDHPGVHPGASASFIDLLGNLRRLSDDALEIQIMDAQGDAHAIPPPKRLEPASAADPKLSGQPRILQAKELFIAEPVQNKASGNWIVPVTYPVNDSRKQFSAVTATIQLDRIALPFDAQRLKPNGSITLFRTGGVTLFRTPAIEGSIGKSIAQAPDYIEHLSAKPRGLYRVKGAFDGVERMVGHARLGNYPVIVAVTASIDDVLQPWWRELWQLLSLALATTGAALLITLRAINAGRIAQKKLADGEQRFRTLIEHAPDAILVVDADEQRIIDANPMAEKLFERTRGELLSGGIERFYSPVQPGGLSSAEAIRQAQERSFSGESVLIERRLRSPSGKEITVEVRIDDMSDNGRRLLRGSFIDISERKAAEDALRESEMRLRMLMETSPLPMLITTSPPESKVLMLNQRFNSLIGYSIEDIPDINAWWPRAYPDPGYRDEVRQRWNEAMSSLLASGRHTLEKPVAVEISCKDGSRRFFEIHVSLQADRCLIVFNDLTERRAYERELARVANYDTLTNLPNRRLLTDRMDQIIARTRRKSRMLAVCYVDLDEFKPVNDLHGHATGDKVLIEAARRMSEAVRVEDTAARLGGDEFVLLLVDLEQDSECEQVLARVTASLTRPFLLNEQVSVVLSASIGVALFPSGGKTPDELMRNADQAMYAAKQAGRNRINFFVPPSSETNSG